MTKAKEKLQLIKKGNPNLIAAILCLAFFLICLHYSLKLNLWGDEAYSLQLAGKGWQQIFTNLDVHLPTYYFFLKILISIFGDSNELILRLFHSVLFSLGLFLGYKTILFLSNSPKKSLLVLLAAVVSPTFVFYSTNLRMYPFLFLFSMFYVLRLSYIIIKTETLTKNDWTIYFIAASCLILTDYPGIVVFLIGSGLLSFKFFKLRKFKNILLAFVPITTLLIYYSLLLPTILKILTWGINSELQVNLIKAKLPELTNLGYSIFRVAFDLFSTSQKNLFSALSFPLLFAFGLLLSLFFFIGKKKKVLADFFVVCFAFYWLLETPSGYSLTRAFLPAIFFMPAFLLLAQSWLPKSIAKLNIILVTVLILLNFFQVLNPSLRLYSLVPYKAIALDTASIAKKEETKNIYFSDNSLNNLSIKRYIEKNNAKLHLSWVIANSKPDLQSKGNFIFVSHMGENNNFVDYQKFPKDYQVTNVKNYIKLADLPYNSFWKKQITDKAFQEYAVSIYLVKVK